MYSTLIKRIAGFIYCNKRQLHFITKSTIILFSIYITVLMVHSVYDELQNNHEYNTNHLNINVKHDNENIKILTEISFKIIFAISLSALWSYKQYIKLGSF